MLSDKNQRLLTDGIRSMTIPIETQSKEIWPCL